MHRHMPKHIVEDIRLRRVLHRLAAPNPRRRRKHPRRQHLEERSAGRNPLTGVELHPVRGRSLFVTSVRFGRRSCCSPIRLKPSRYSAHACCSSCGILRPTSSDQIACCSGVYAAQSCSIRYGSACYQLGCFGPCLHLVSISLDGEITSPPSLRALCPRQIRAACLPSKRGHHRDKHRHRTLPSSPSPAQTARRTYSEPLPPESAIPRSQQIPQLIRQPRQHRPHRPRRQLVQVHRNHPPRPLHHELHQEPTHRQHHRRMTPRPQRNQRNRQQSRQHNRPPAPQPLRQRAEKDPADKRPHRSPQSRPPKSPARRDPCHASETSDTDPACHG